MLIFDGDYPMAYGAIDLNRDLTLPIEEVRAVQEGSREQDRWPAAGTMASLPEMRRGKIAAALVKISGRIQRENSPIWGYRSGDVAYAAAQAHLAYYRILERRGEARILRTSGDFSEHIQTWSEATNYEDLPVGMVLGMEGQIPSFGPNMSTNGGRVGCAQLTWRITASAPILTERGDPAGCYLQPNRCCARWTSWGWFSTSPTPPMKRFGRHWIYSLDR